MDTRAYRHRERARDHTKIKNRDRLPLDSALPRTWVDRTLFYVKVGAPWCATSTRWWQRQPYPSKAVTYGSCWFNSQFRQRWQRRRQCPRGGAGCSAQALSLLSIANWSAKVEYDYMDFGSKDVAFAVSGRSCDTTNAGAGNNTRTVSVDQTLHVVKFGVNYRWGAALGRRRLGLVIPRHARESRWNSEGRRNAGPLALARMARRKLARAGFGGGAGSCRPIPAATRYGLRKGAPSSRNGGPPRRGDPRPPTPDQPPVCEDVR